MNMRSLNFHRMARSPRSTIWISNSKTQQVTALAAILAPRNGRTLRRKPTLLKSIHSSSKVITPRYWQRRKKDKVRKQISIQICLNHWTMMMIAASSPLETDTTNSGKILAQSAKKWGTTQYQSLNLNPKKFLPKTSQAFADFRELTSCRQSWNIKAHRKKKSRRWSSIIWSQRGNNSCLKWPS